MSDAPGWESISLSFREFFRILVPGAYTFGLLKLFLPDSGPAWLFASASGAAACILFLGILAYSPHVHEWLPPYSTLFYKAISRLNDAVAEAAGLRKTESHKDFYKYFLESRIDPGVRERIHYFSSFYYMLVQLSFLSAVGTIISVAANVCLRKLGIMDWVPGVLFLVAGILFGFLGYKQWKAIIEQQVILVRDKRSELKELADKCKLGS